ncbi:hydroxyacylglutathione hydrolase [Alteromonadaceae bacterium M269]|nr:hydroxyacylglutathione hydrolase [Alteromonadaceae bacterium M269]
MSEKPVNIVPIPAFQDNYIWCMQQENACIVVDPGDATPVLDYVEKHQLTLTDILITHHHPDHTGGVKELVKNFPDIRVIGIDSSRIPYVTHKVTDGDQVDIPSLNTSFRVLMLPGHTKDHIAFYGDLGLFCGDTLFSAGCGRLFEGSPEQMQHSLSRLTDLPSDTKVYCTHEYTLANVSFALAAEPNNQDLQRYQEWAQGQRKADTPTLPSTIEEQLAINPFLRTSSEEIQKTLSEKLARNVHESLDVFTELRRWKDHF